MKNFDEVYQTLVSRVDTQKLNEIRQKELKRTTFTVIAILALIAFAFIGFASENDLFSTLFVVGLILFFVYLVYLIINSFKNRKTSNSYKNLFKDEVMENLVNTYDSGLHFDRTQSISRQEYNQGQFEFYEIYHSNDLIVGDLNGSTFIKMGDVLTQNESTDSDGNTTYYTVFSGLFCKCNLSKDTRNTLKVRADKGIFGKNKSQVNMDSQEFEKNFDVYSSDKVLAMRLLTSDIMDFMINFKKENKIRFDFSIINDVAYIRIHCSDLFESHLSKDPLDQNILLKYYNYLHFMCKLCSMITDVINEKDI